MSITLGRSETPLVDVYPSLRVLLYPVSQFLIMTGCIWLAIGGIDRYLGAPIQTSPQTGFAQYFQFFWNFVDNTLPTLLGWTRIALIILWIVCALLLLLRPVIRRRRTRTFVTNQRIVLDSPKIDTVQIPIRDIDSVNVKKKNIQVWVYGLRKPFTIQNMPYRKEIVKIIQQQMDQSEPSNDWEYAEDYYDN